MQTQIQLQVNKITLVYSYNPTTGAIGATASERNPESYILDLYPDETIPISYAVSDPADASVRPTPFSKSFLIPATATNSKAFNFAYMASSERAWFTGRAEIVGNEYLVFAVYGSITVDGIPIFVGTVDLTNTVIEQGEVSSYEINFLATEINLFNTYLNNRLLTQQPFTVGATSGGVFGVDISDPLEVVIAAGVTGPDTTFTLGAGSYGGFMFGYPDFGYPDDGFAGSPGVCLGETGPAFNTTEDLRSLYATGASGSADPRAVPLRAGYNLLPFPFVKYYIDQAFESTPFTYVSEFFESDEFKSLVLLYLDNTKVPSNSWMYRFGYNPDTFFPDRSVVNPVVVRDIDFLDECAVPGTFPVDANARTEDLYNFWDSVEGSFILPAAGTYKISIKAKAIVRFGWDQLVGGQGGNCPGGTPNANPYPHATYPLIGPNSSIDLRNAANAVVDFVNINNPTKVGADVLSVPSTYIKGGGGPHYQWEAVYNLYSTPIEFTFSGNEGDKFYIKYAYDSQNYWNAPVAGGCNAFPVGERLYQDAMDLIVEDIRVNTIVWPRTVPPITEKQLFQDVVKLFNLYFEITPNSNQLKIEPRNDFYDETQTLDWTDKLDISKPRRIEQFLPPKAVFFKYQDTENFADNERQKLDNLYNLNAGSRRVQYINGQGDQEVQLEAGSLTPYISYSTTFATGAATGLPQYPQFLQSGTYYNIPGLALYPKQDDGLRELAETSNYFFAFANGLVTTPVMWNSATTRTPVFTTVGSTDGTAHLKVGGTGATAAQILSPYSRLFGAEAIDLGFKPSSTFPYRYGQRLGSLPGNLPTGVANSTPLYEKYYEGYYENLNRQRFFKAQFKLTQEDISNFSFRNPIYVRFPNGDAGTYIVQSIDYDPTNYGSSSVVLTTYNPLYIN